LHSYKNRVFLKSLFIFLVLSFCTLEVYGISANDGATKKYVVVIDPGHGGSDPGTLGQLGSKEKDINLLVAEKVKQLLSKYKVTVQLTRLDDSYVEVHERALMSNFYEADLFISIHLNSYTENREIRGSEIYYFDYQREAYTKRLILKENFDEKKDKKVIEEWVNDKENSIKPSIKFANIIADNVEKNGIKLRGVMPNLDLAVMAYGRAPTVLFELEFLSNLTVEAKFKNGIYVDLFAKIIKDSILQYFDIRQ